MVQIVYITLSSGDEGTVLQYRLLFFLTKIQYCPRSIFSMVLTKRENPSARKFLRKRQSYEALNQTTWLLRKFPLWFLLDAVTNFFVLKCSTHLFALLLRCWVSVVRHNPYISQLPLYTSFFLKDYFLDMLQCSQTRSVICQYVSALSCSLANTSIEYCLYCCLQVDQITASFNQENKAKMKF